MIPDSVVVDTDVVSFLFKRDTRAELYRPHLEGKVLIVSFMTVAELDRWALQHNWGEARRNQMEIYLNRFSVHPVDRELCLKWAEIVDEAQRQGRVVQCADAWIAATALAHNIPLITHNYNHYKVIKRLALVSEQDA